MIKIIIWITGNSGAGKSTMAQQMRTKGSVILDGDTLRGIYPTGFSQKDRWEHNLRVAKIAKMLESQGVDVIVALICPYKKLRDEVQAICDCGFIYLKVKAKGKEYVYEYEEGRRYWIQSILG